MIWTAIIGIVGYACIIECWFGYWHFAPLVPFMVLCYFWVMD